MEPEIRNTDCLSEQEVECFAARMHAFATTLSERELRMLYTLLIEAMDPLDRMSICGDISLLTPEEKAYLRILDDQLERE